MPDQPIPLPEIAIRPELLPPSAVLVSPMRPVGRSHARVNLRSHFLRGGFRVLVLAVADLTVFALLWLVLREVRDDALLGSTVAQLTDALFPMGLLQGPRFLLALAVGLGAAGTFSPGDNRRDANRLYAGAALAAFAAMYATAWDGLGLLALRMVLLSLIFGSALALGRSVVDRLVRTYKPLVYVRRAIVVRARNEQGEPMEVVPGNLEPFQIVADIDSSVDEATLSADVEAHIEREKADSVIVVGDLPRAVFVSLADAVLAHGCRLMLSPTAAAAGIEPRTIWLEGHPYIEMNAPALRGFQLVVKRLLDIIGSTVALALFSPLMLGIALWIKLNSPGPIFFAQRRLGQGGRQFACLKFRTMRQDAERILREDEELFRTYVENDFKLPPELDPRVTAPGRFLRKTSLDELPQLLNVLAGHMSLVGPRPIVPAEIMHYEGAAALLLSVKPGMTGKWAVDGRSDVAYPERAILELEYVRQWSLWTDVMTLVKTPFVVVAGRGAH